MRNVFLAWMTVQGRPWMQPAALRRSDSDVQRTGHRRGGFCASDAERAPAQGNASDADNSDDFHIGYQKKTLRRLARRIQVVVAALAILVPVFTIVMASAQSPFDHGRYEFSTRRSMEGGLHEEPIPMLPLPRIFHIRRQ